MTTPDIRPTRETWKQFCQETELTSDEEAAWHVMAKAITHDDTDKLFSFIFTATQAERTGLFQAEQAITEDWSDLVQTADARRRCKRAELATWARWQEQAR